VTRQSLEEVVGERAAHARRRFEIPILIAALAVVPVIYFEETATSALAVTVVSLANWAIWAAFAAEFITVATLTQNRWTYTKRAWLDVVVIVVSFPLLPTLLASTRLFRLTRLARVFRILRLIRLAAILSRGGRAASVIFKKRGLGYVILLTLLVALGVGGAFAILEGVAIADGIWWAIVTVTTVGYGDMFPVTTEGRLAAAVLMLLGIGFVAFITASIAAYFVDQGETNVADEVQRIHNRLDQIERLLTDASLVQRADAHPSESREPNVY
jgi:voltage-gated potassium channel